jgi:hypothetical protein
MNHVLIDIALKRQPAHDTPEGVGVGEAVLRDRILFFPVSRQYQEQVNKLSPADFLVRAKFFYASLTRVN